MSKVKFKVGDKVIHRSKDKVGEITEIFDDGSGKNRFYVKAGHWTWSVPEESILQYVKSSTYKDEKQED